MDRPKKRRVTPRVRYTLQDHRRVCTAYLIIGNVRQTAIETDIPARTISDWLRSDWWPEMEAEITTILARQSVAKMRGCLDNTLDEIKDRLDNGDIGFYRGETYRHPPQLRDLTKLAGGLVDRVRLAEGKATHRTERVELSESARAFERIAERYLSQVAGQMAGVRPVIDGEVVRTLPGDLDG